MPWIITDTQKDYLFSKGLLVGEGEQAEAFAAVFAFAKKLNIRIGRGRSLASKGLLRFAAERLGEYVPEPFYRGFPRSVRELSADALLYDQLFHYALTYGMGDFSQPGHSVFEKDFERLAFCEKTQEQSFDILTPNEACKQLLLFADEMLAGSRPLNDLQYEVLLSCVRYGGLEVRECACKDTAIRLLLDTRNQSYARFLALSDVVKLVDYLNYTEYGSKNIKKLNLKNQDRRLVSGVLDAILRGGTVNLRDCFEKQAIWCGLLHHIHYKPRCREAELFVRSIRGERNQSAFSKFEGLMAGGQVAEAAQALCEDKGSGALLRHLNYILSRCESEEQIEAVLGLIETKNAVVLLQLMMQYANYRAEGARAFRFARYNLLRVHTETEEEQAARRSSLSPEQVEAMLSLMRSKLCGVLKGRVGRVFISPEMYRVAVPLQESTSQGGFGVLPKGSRIPIGEGRKLRAFTYWEKVDDIDLSVIGLSESGEQTEFSWRTMFALQSKEITYSGDQTSGYEGGSEYFDIDLPLFKKKHPSVRYLVFCDNVYSATPFCECTCRAGYMLRDTEDSGRIFEPKTVKSSFTVNCNSTYAYLFGIDLLTNEFVWLNAAHDSRATVAGATRLAFLMDYFKAVQVMNLGLLFEQLAAELVEDPTEADVVVCDHEVKMREGARRIRSCDFESVMALLG